MSTGIQISKTDTLIRAGGSFAILSGIVSALGIIFLIAMFIFFATPNKSLGETFGMLNDICVALQYLLAIPVALALDQILQPYNPGLIRFATLLGILMMLMVIGLQLALIFGVIPFERQVGWVTLAMIVGVGSWLMMTGLVARSTGRFPHSVLMSGIAVPYLGFPVWAFWLGWLLLGWIPL
jgi:hypothetical protein